MIKQQLLGTTTGTKFTHLYACISMDRVEIESLEKEHLKTCVWLRCIDYIFFGWTHRKDENCISFLYGYIDFALILKLVSAIFYQIFIFSTNGSPLKTMKNVFYFI